MSSFAVPSGWRFPTSTASLDSKRSLANDVIQTLTPFFNPSTGTVTTNSNVFFSTSASMMTSIALFDLNSGSATYESFVRTYHRGSASFSYQVSDMATWGLAALTAFRAYRDSTMLEFAIATWEVVNQFVVQPLNAASGTQPTRNVTFPSTCNGASVAGGVFLLAEQPGDTRVNSETVGSFISLSAHLSSLTSNNTFTSAAQLSAQFIQSQLYDGTVVQDSITLSDCSESSDPAKLMADESGFFIEGLSLLSRHDISWLPLLHNLISSTISTALWTASNGINIESTRDSSGPLFFRGLYSAWNGTSHNSTSPNPAISNFIESYIHVQFNALQDLARNPGSNVYATSWSGPPTSSTDPLGQYYALEIFNSEIGFSSLRGSNSTASPTSSAAFTPTSVSSTSTSTNHPSRIGAVLGGVLGGLFLLLAMSIFLIHRQRRSHRRAGDTRYDLETTPVPFTSTEITGPLTREKGTQAERSRLTILSMPNPSSSTGVSNRIAAAYEQAAQSMEQVSPASSPTALRNPGAVDGASIQGIYHLLTTLITSIQSPHAPEEQPPEYDETRRGPI